MPESEKAEKAKPKWYQTRVAIGVICALVGIGVGAAETEPPEDSEVYTALASKYDDLQGEMSAAGDAQDEVSSEQKARAAALDEREDELDARQDELAKLTSSLEDRQTSLDAAESAVEEQETSRAAAADPAPFAGKASCTTTSSGTCIQGGQFCPKDKYGQTGTDANGRTYTCTGDGDRPHWI